MKRSGMPDDPGVMGPHTHGRLSYVFPGTVSFPAADPESRMQSHRSQLCEIVWLEPALFLCDATDSVTLLFEEYYSALSTQMGRSIAPGELGEQLVAREIAPEIFVAGAIVLIGDARFKIVSCPIPLSGILPSCALQFLEEGLVEPGAPVTVIS